MQPKELTAVSVFVLYFLVIILLFALILRSILIDQSGTIKWRYGLFGLVAFIHTWYWMFQYMSWSLQSFEARESPSTNVGTGNQIARWLVNTSLFEEAWWTVCARAANWWWSEQLCLFTAGFFVVFLHQQNIRYKWAYMLLGQMVAVSVAWSLALLASSRGENKHKMAGRLPLSLTIPVTMSYLCIVLVPYTGTGGFKLKFLAVLTVMHGLLFVPLLLGNSAKTQTDHWKIRGRSFCMFLAILGMGMRIRTMLELESAIGLWTIVHSHPAQASISWDILYTSLVWLVWTMEERDIDGCVDDMADDADGILRTGLVLVFGSVGVAAPIGVPAK